MRAYGVWIASITVAIMKEYKKEKDMKIQYPPPYILLANHIEKQNLIMVYRVKNLDKTALHLG
jgi:hypothetical protein